MLFSAVHLYPPSSCLPMMVKGKDTELLSETLVQVMLAFGLASASHVGFTVSLSFTVWLTEMSTMSGGSGNNKKTFLSEKETKTDSGSSRVDPSFLQYNYNLNVRFVSQSNSIVSII